MRILDYSFARPDPAQIKAQGFQGVMRYLSPNAGKNLTAPERDALRAQGLAIGLVWEWYAQRALEGHDAGVQDGQAALVQANALGVPADVAIFFAVDWDATPEQQQAINDYLTGAKTSLGDRVGEYGGFYPVSRALDAGVIKYAWQTYAWSGGQWDNRAQLRQELNGQWGGSVDFDEDVAGTAGLWVASNPVASEPVQPVSTPPAPAQTHQYVIKAGDTFWGLEQVNGWSHGILQNLNPGVDPTKLQISEQITVPGAGTPTPQPAPTGAKHTIQSGDTFWGLEQANGWQHGTLQGLNPGVVATALQVGQQINIPGDAGNAPQQHTYGKYTIKGGDTFWGIEAAMGWSHGVLQQLNPGANPLTLQIGEIINTP